MRRFLLILAWASLCLLSRPVIFVDASDEGDIDIDCVDGLPDEAPVTSCSETPGAPSDEPPGSFDESDLVNEVLEEEKKPKQAYRSAGAPAPNSSNDGQNQYSKFEEEDVTEGSAAMQQLKQTTTKLIRRYYDPLPHQGKCAIGTICGFTASRLSLGVANRLFRLAGATWVLSEALHVTGYCDEAKCVPEEARPWVGILRRALIKQCIRVRMIARRIWDQDRIREMVKKDELVAGGFAAGAFVGFVV